MVRRRPATLQDDPLWYKDAIVYELHVRAFLDSDGDGIGDFRGLSQKLDYLQDLGVTAIWLLPFYPSPLMDDGYDTSDYRGVHPDYGSLVDFRNFLSEAHARGLRVITELVVNHTSNQHPWFERARRSPPGSKHRDFYVWSDTPDRYREARVIFQDFETSNWSWDPVAKAYYWHRFYSHQPDLNFENPMVRRAVLQTLDYWMKMGVDGFRLDAIPYLYEREGTNCENLPETHAFLRQLRRYVDERYSSRMLLAEANQWPEDSVHYFGDGDECHMAFHFPLMPRLFMALRMEDRFPILDILDQTPDIPNRAQWAIFLRNHDELTLEMVTDEERDYMYRVYAEDPRARVNLGIRRRLAPLLGNDRRRIELMNGLLFSLPGTPVLYYGDEIGMGDNYYLGDRNAVRTPMQWSPDRNAGFSRASPQRLYLPVVTEPEYHYESLNVSAQLANPHSLLWWMKRIMALRKRHLAFGRGSIRFLSPENHRVIAFLRQYEDERILVVANLSRFAQFVRLDLSEFEGTAPVELFGGATFPVVTRDPWLLTLAGHTFHWFELPVPRSASLSSRDGKALPVLRLARRFETILSGRGRAKLEEVLPKTLPCRRWFGGKSREIRRVELLDAIPVVRGRRQPAAHIVLFDVHYQEGEPDRYLLPLAVAVGKRGDELFECKPSVAFARIESREKGASGILYDAFGDPEFAGALLGAFSGRHRFSGGRGEVVATPEKAFRRIRRGATVADLEPRILHADQSNTSVVYGDRFILKLVRKVDYGVNPDLELGRLLTEELGFTHSPPLAGAIEYRRGREEPRTLGILQGYVPNEGDAWQFSLDALSRYFERALSHAAGNGRRRAVVPAESIVELASMEIPEEVRDAVGTYLDSARLLGRRTAEMHRALSTDTERPALRPERFSTLYQRSLYQSMRNLSGRVFELLSRTRKSLKGPAREEADQVLDLIGEIETRFRMLLGHRMGGLRIRVHGDYHLGQVLHTGNDFVIIDFEGEPARPLTERRLKRSPLRDVAGMIRSFHYASHAGILRVVSTGLVGNHDAVVRLGPWARSWYRYVSATFLAAYLADLADTDLLPGEEDLYVLLRAFMLEKAIYELSYELNNRPDWVRTPLRGILDLLEEGD